MINIILYRPEKPANVGNILRTAAAVGSVVHIIGPLSFEINDDNLKRAGMDYLVGLDYRIYKDYDEFLNVFNNKTIYYVTRYGSKPHSSFDYKQVKGDINFMFGRESTGIPKEILSAHLDTCMRLPMKVDARSLNLSNCVAIVVYEALRQLDYLDLATKDFLKGEDWLEK